MLNNFLKKVYKKSIDGYKKDEKSIEKFISTLIVAIRFNFKSISEKKSIILPTTGNEWINFSISKMKTISYIPSPVEYHHGTEEHLEELNKIYRYKGFADIEKGDLVIDVGAYTGTFSRAAAPLADRVIAIDPIALLSRCLERNLKRYDNTEILKKGLWKSECKKRMKLSISPSDNSLIGIDNEELEKDKEIEVSLKTLTSIAKERDIKVIDFLKVEAEGVEPEILKGSLGGGVLVKKVCVNCGAERNGKEPTEKVVSILSKFDYSIKVRRTDIWDAPIVFARRNV